MDHTHTTGWIFFHLLVFLLLFLDLRIFHRTARPVKLTEALWWSFFWIVLALLFNAGIYYFLGRNSAAIFFTGYVLERSLSFDNLFVFLLIFEYFNVPAHLQRMSLYWGIIGALVLRALFIAGGVTALHYFHPVIYVFGIFLVFTGVKLGVQKETKMDPGKNPLLKLFRKWMPVTQEYHEGKYFVKEQGVTHATPLFIVLLVIATTDIVFAVDSIPAILGVTTDPFLVYTSNVFAVLGLRALYFALAALMKMFHYLNYGLAAILVLVGVKMLIADFYEVPIGFSLGIILGILVFSILVSIFRPPKGEG